jgi:alpha-L-rhamnosidase
MAQKTTIRTAATIIFTFLFTFCAIPGKDNSFHPVNLRCENLNDPIAIDVATPLLSWNMESSRRNQLQSAYRILVSGSQDNIDKDLGDFWDTGKIASGQSVNIKYEGKDLHSRDKLYWKVKIWNAEDEASAWSEISSWEMSLIKQSNWQALWIGLADDGAPLSPKTHPAPYFRNELEVNKNVKSANVYVSGLGYYELYLNGSKVGDHVLAPAQTNYDIRPLPKLLYHYDDQSTTRVFYNTFDVTDQLIAGKNAIGMVLGNGWYNQRDRRVEGDLWYATPRLIFQLEIEYTNGEKQIVTSNESWKVTTGPMLHDGIFTGELYDARLELGEWSAPGYDDTN